MNIKISPAEMSSARRKQVTAIQKMPTTNTDDRTGPNHFRHKETLQSVQSLTIRSMVRPLGVWCAPTVLEPMTLLNQLGSPEHKNAKTLGCSVTSLTLPWAVLVLVVVVVVNF